MLDKQALLKEMVILADYLDEVGFKKDAEVVDGMIEKVAGDYDGIIGNDAGKRIGNMPGQTSPAQSTGMDRDTWFNNQTARGAQGAIAALKAYILKNKFKVPVQEQKDSSGMIAGYPNINADVVGAQAQQHILSACAKQVKDECMIYQKTFDQLDVKQRNDVINKAFDQYIKDYYSNSSLGSAIVPYVRYLESSYQGSIKKS
jgi:hypothetical protein